MAKKFKTLDWWQVWTGSSDNERSHVDLGVHYGHIDEIALALADKQSGFWCDGKLTFERTKVPKALNLKAKPKRETVNIVISEINDRCNGPSFNQQKLALSGRPVTVTECSQYGAVTIQRS